EALAEVLTLMRRPGLPEEGSVSASSGLLAVDVRAWVADPTQGVAATIDSVDGAEAALEVLARLAPSEPAVDAVVVTGRACWAELPRRGNADPETCLVGLTLDAAGLVRRLVLVRAPLVPPVPAQEFAPPGRPILKAYFEDLMNSRFREAAAH